MIEIAAKWGADKQVFADLEEGYGKREQEIALEVRVTIGRKALH